jgi:hypothetical protein
MALAFDKTKVICETVCVQDGDEKGVMIGPDCYCANKRDVKKILTKVNRNLEVNVIIDRDEE